MSSSDTYPAAGIARSIADRPMRRRAMIAIPALLLATVFTFAGAPMATAAPAVANNGIIAAWEPDSCRGNQPGVCPYGYPVTQQGIQPNTSQMQPNTSEMQPSTSPDRHMAPHQSSSSQR